MRFMGRSHHHNALDWVFYRSQRLETVPALNFGRQQVYGNHVIAPVAHFPKERAAEVLRIPRNAHHGNSMESKKILDITNGRHRDLLTNTCIRGLP